MANAKAEFIDFVATLPKVIAATIEIYDEVYNLKIAPSEEEYSAFLDKLDFDYNDGYGSQELFGTIWFEGGTWGEREEYDGSEWWGYHMCPEIPPKLF